MALVPVNLELCQKRWKQHKYAVDRLMGNSVPVGTKGLADAMSLLEEMRKRG